MRDEGEEEFENEEQKQVSETGVSLLVLGDSLRLAT
jgi:hypothetical protein